MADLKTKKLNQTAALLSFGWVFGFQLDLLEKHVITLTVLAFTPELIPSREYHPHSNKSNTLHIPPHKMRAHNIRRKSAR